MKALWKGSLSFGLVNIPIRLYSATEQKTVGFKMLCRTCHSPLQYKRWCPHCEKEVTWDNIVKGLEIKKGAYFVITKEKIEALRPTKTDTIEIIEFIKKETIDPIYFATHYYIGPQKEKDKAYYLLKKTLETSNKFAIGRFVMRDKDYICAIEAYKTGLLLTTLNYTYEIRDITKIAELAVAAPTLKKDELKLANDLIKKMTKKTFDMAKFKDTFAQELKKLIKKAVKGKKIEKIKAEKPKKIEKRQNLMEALRASIH